MGGSETNSLFADESEETIQSTSVHERNKGGQAGRTQEINHVR